MDDKKRVLIVEDDPELALSMKSGFEKSGFAVDTASDGIMGLNKARKGTPDLIILSGMIPRLDGYHVCRFLKFDQKYMHIPIIMVIGRTQENEGRLCTETGANEYLFKPFEINELVGAAQKYMI
jgi:two-component system alkaline phosphatase synthesis response regulator PhoP